MRQTRLDQHHDPDIVECATCGRPFDLAHQTYYGPDCPDCRDGDNHDQ